MFHWAVQRVKNVDKFIYDLERPIQGMTQDTETVVEEEMSSFAALAAMTGVRMGTPDPAGAEA